MKSRCTIIALLALALLFVACNKAPEGVISESKMARLMVDLNKAQAFVDMHGDQFATDSAKMALKQSIFAKHGVDQALYDHSLEWYGHNMDVYTEVCDRALRHLEDERKRLAKSGYDSRDITETPMAAAQRPAAGQDTVDVWKGQRAWVLTAGMQQGLLQWDQQPDDDSRTGDKYTLAVKVASNTRSLAATLLADYNDGTTSSITRPLSSQGWTRISLQTDSMRSLRRIYGYIRYTIQPAKVALLDSTSLTRTHLDRNTYGMIGSQITVQRTRASAAASTTAADAQQEREQDDRRTRDSVAWRAQRGQRVTHQRIGGNPSAIHLRQ